MATKVNMDRYVWEGWTVGAFIRELADWCRDNQPYYKKRIPEVNSYFARMYNLK